jgi:hypothetical protein
MDRIIPSIGVKLRFKKRVDDIFFAFSYILSFLIIIFAKYSMFNVLMNNLPAKLKRRFFLFKQDKLTISKSNSRRLFLIILFT